MKNIDFCTRRYPKKFYHIKFLKTMMSQPAITCLQVHNRNTKTRCEICSKLTIKIPERRHGRPSRIFIVKSEHISQPVLVFLVLTLSR